MSNDSVHKEPTALKRTEEMAYSNSKNPFELALKKPAKERTIRTRNGSSASPRPYLSAFRVKPFEAILQNGEQFLVVHALQIVEDDFGGVPLAVDLDFQAEGHSKNLQVL